jgi:hypothetical protein
VIDFEASNPDALNLGLSLPYLNAQTGCTAACWVTPESIGADVKFIAISIGPPPGTTTESRMELGMLTGTVRLAVRNADADPAAFNSSTIVLVAGTRAHIAVTYDCSSKAIRFFLNGAFVNTVTATNPTGTAFASTNAKNGAIGAQDDLSGANYDGTMEDARVWSRVLADNEIACLFHGRGHDGIAFGLIMRLFMDEDVVGATVTAPKNIGQQGPNPTVSGTPKYVASQLAPRRRV